jgi:hypothetical protein
MIGGNQAALGNTIEDSGLSGIEVNVNSMVRLQWNLVRNNALADAGQQAISIGDSSAVRSLGHNQITGNHAVGIVLNRASSFRTGKVQGGDPNYQADVITNNAGGGIWAAENSSVDLRDGTTITGNTYNNLWSGFGVWVSEGAHLRLRDTIISGNASGGIRVRTGAGVRFSTGNSVTGNTGYGLDCANNGGPSYFGLTGNTVEAISPTCLGF